MLEVLRWSICHPTLYGGTDAGDAPLPMINPPDHALYAYMFSQHWETVQYAAAETSGTPQPTVRTAGAPARTFQRGAFLDY